MARNVGTTRGAKKRADVLFSQIIRSRGACECCESTRNLQCAHIISRRYSNTRCDLANAYCLCAGCHMWFTDHPVEFAEFVRTHTPDYQYDRLLALSIEPAKVDWELQVALLKTIAKERAA